MACEILGGILMAKYAMIVSWSNDDNCYIVSVPDLPGCMADGETPQKAVENAEVIIAEWIETAQMLGREIPEPSFSAMSVQKRKWLKISPVSKAAQRATRKYEKENYDSILVKFPKGTKERIKNSGSSVNGYIVKKVIESLEKEGL